MILSMIAAMGKNRELGKDNKLLWHISEDLKNFKRLTKGKPIIMGRKTFESLPGILPHRPHIVITRNSEFSPEGVEVFNDPLKVVEELKSRGVEEAFVIGGSSIYDFYLDHVDQLYLSKVDWEGEADVFFPEHENRGLELIDTHDHERIDSTPKWTFCKYSRK